MFLAAALTVLQAVVWRATPAVPTVGDTIVLERVLPVVAGTRARTRGLDANDRVEPLDAPDILSAGDGLHVRHRVALFAPGAHAIPMPAIELLHPDGNVEVVLGDTAFVRVVSVIPDTAKAPVPMPSRAPIARPVRDQRRALLPMVAVLLVLGLWLAWRSRPRREIRVDEPAAAAPAELPLMRWLAAGERRAVATVAVHRLRAAVAELVPEAARTSSVREWATAVAAARPGWPVEELADVLRALERARFAPLGADDLAELVDRADVARSRLTFPVDEETA